MTELSKRDEAEAKINETANKLFSLVPEFKYASEASARAIRFANICSIGEVLITYSEKGEDSVSFDLVVNKAKKTRKLTNSEVDAIYDAKLAYDDAVTSAVVLELATNCKCSFR